MRIHALFAFALLTPPALFLAAGPPTNFPALGREIEALVREKFYDAARGERWAKENAGYAGAIEDAESFHRETRRRLAGLGASHTEYYTADDPGYRDLLSIFEPVLHR